MKKNSAFQLSVVLFMLTGVALLFSACYKDYGLSTADYDVVLTSFDEDAVFHGKSVYYLEEEFIDLDDPDPDNENPEQPDNAQAIIDAIVAELTAYGYTRELVDPTSANVGIRLAYTETDYFYYYNDCWYWYWSYCWYYPPGWGGVQYAYTAGTVFIEMGDLENFTVPGDDIPIMWLAGINGLLDDTSLGLVERIQDAITQAFTQSPYLEQ